MLTKLEEVEINGSRQYKLYATWEGCITTIDLDPNRMADYAIIEMLTSSFPIERKQGQGFVRTTYHLAL